MAISSLALINSTLTAGNTPSATVDTKDFFRGPDGTVRFMYMLNTTRLSKLTVMMWHKGIGETSADARPAAWININDAAVGWVECLPGSQVYFVIATADFVTGDSIVVRAAR